MDSVKRRTAGAFGALRAVCFLGLTADLILYPGEVRDAVGSSLLYCLTGLVPSLFPFMALTSFAVNSGAGEALGKPLGFLARYVFRLPRVCAAPILMSFIGGYPAGAKGTALLLEQGKIDEEQAGRMMMFCVNPGVAFVVTYLGGGVLGSIRLGWALFLSVTVAGAALGVLSGLFRPVPEREKPGASSPPDGALMRSVTDASQSVLVMCGCIVLFSGFTALLRGSGLFGLLCKGLSAPGLFTPMESAALLSFLLEVTGGVGAASRLRAGTAFYAFGLAWGGLCVHLQVFSMFRRFPLPRWKFFLSRFFHGLLSAGCCALLLKFLPGGETQALAAAGQVSGVGAFSSTAAGGLSLALMCAAFLLIATKDGEGT